MKEKLVKAYHHLPSVLKSLVASGYGYYLRSWRYGPETEVLAQKALERDTWQPEQWQQWRQERLTGLLEHAATKVPYYRSHWEARRQQGDDASWQQLENWPILTKDALRETPEAFVAEDVDPGSLYKLSTSGTSGKPLTLWRSELTMQTWYALFEARWRYWYGVSRHDRWAILGGQLVTPVERQAPPFWVWNAGLKQLYLSTMHISPDHVADYIEALERYEITYLWGYASSMHSLAQMALEQGLRAPPLKVAISNAEALLPYQRETIGEFFGCPVKNTYGMAEAVAEASECEYGAMHLWADAGVVEVFADGEDESVPAGTVGRLICTGLVNKDMPLIRYEVGDRGALAAESGFESACACGRTLPVLERIEGRTIDNVVTADGRKIFWLNPVFYNLPIREGQVIQEALGQFHIKIIPADGYEPKHSNDIVQRLKERVGEAEVEVDVVDDIPRSANGKFRAVINKVEGAGGKVDIKIRGANDEADGQKVAEPSS